MRGSFATSRSRIDFRGPATPSDGRILEHFYLVDQIARRLRRRLPRWVLLEDLRGDGMLGLMLANLSYDPGRGVRFATFASHRIRGAMIDGLRTLDWVPKYQRAKMKNEPTAGPRELNRSIINVRNEPNLAPTPASMVQLGVRNEPTADALRERIPRPGDELETRDLLAHLLHQLPPNARRVVYLKWIKGLEQREIARRWGVSQARVSVIHSGAMRYLRSIGAGDKRSGPFHHPDRPDTVNRRNEPNLRGLPMPSTSDFTVKGKVTEVTADGVLFAPAGGTYVLKLRTASRYAGAVGKPVSGLLKVTGRKVYTVSSGGNFITPIVGPPKIIQGLVKYIDDRQIVVGAAPNVNVIVMLPTGDFTIDLDAGRVRVGAMANVVAFPGASFEPLENKGAGPESESAFSNPLPDTLIPSTLQPSP